MTPQTRANWAKVKAALEASGNVTCHMYRRACAAVLTGKDPGLPFGREAAGEN
jgi:hypothetical protein